MLHFPKFHPRGFPTIRKDLLAVLVVWVDWFLQAKHLRGRLEYRGHFQLSFHLQETQAIEGYRFQAERYLQVGVGYPVVQFPYLHLNPG